MLHVGKKHRPVHGSFKHKRCGHCALPQAAHEGDCFPMSLRRVVDEPCATRSTAAQPHHRGVRAGFVMNTNRAGSNMPCSRIQRRRARATSARFCSAAYRVFFEADIVPPEEAPHRAAAAGNPSLAHRRDDLIQRQIRLLGNQSQQPVRMFFQRRNTPPSWPGRDTSSSFPALQPFHCRTGTDISNQPLRVVTLPLSPHQAGRIRKSREQGFGIDLPPKIDSMPRDSAHSSKIENPRFNSAEICSRRKEGRQRE